MRHSIGKVYLLFDSFFSFIYRTQDQKESKDECTELKDRIETLAKQWIKIGLSFTSK